MSSSLCFGTSGLRGSASGFGLSELEAYIFSFIEILKEKDLIDSSCVVFIGRDLRPSSVSIFSFVQYSLALFGFSSQDCGVVSTVALAFYAMKKKMPSIMITGSHLQEHQNGLKFYRPDGEITKCDESVMVSLYDTYKDRKKNFIAGFCEHPEQEPIDIVPFYVQRYKNFFPPNMLSGLKIAVYQHSSVQRDSLVEIISYLGGEVFPIGKSKNFVSFDTEAMSLYHLNFLKKEMLKENFDAIVSSDADGDRAFLMDEKGQILRGDQIGAITASYLGADSLVVPLTVNSILQSDFCGMKSFVTRVGSPYVVEGIKQAKSLGYISVVGFEANGGFILGSDIIRNARTISALPTRDSFLPILSCLAMMVEKKTSLSEISFALGCREMRSTCIPNIQENWLDVYNKKIHLFVVQQIGYSRLDERDGLRFVSKQNEIIHFRMSRNISGLRIYIEACDVKRANDLLACAVQYIENNCLESDSSMLIESKNDV